MESNKLLSLGALLGTGYFLFCKDSNTEKKSENVTINTFLKKEANTCNELYDKISLGGDKIDVNCKFKTFNTDIDYIEIVKKFNITTAQISESIKQKLMQILAVNNDINNIPKSNYTITVKTGFTKKVNDFLTKLYDSKVELKDKIFDADTSSKLSDIYSTNKNSKKNYKKIHSYVLNNSILEWNWSEITRGTKKIGNETIKLENSINNKSFLIININDKENLCNISVLYLINDGTNNVTLPIDYQLRNMENAIEMTDKSITKLKNKYIKAFFVDDKKMKSKLQNEIKEIAPLVNLKDKVESTMDKELKSKIVKKINKISKTQVTSDETTKEIVDKLEKEIENKSKNVLEKVKETEDINIEDTLESSDSIDISKIVKTVNKYGDRTFKNDISKDIEKIISEYLESGRKLDLSKLEKIVTIEEGTVKKSNDYNKLSGYDFDDKGYDSDIVIDADYDQKNGIDADYNQPKEKVFDKDYDQKKEKEEKEEITDFNARLGLSKVTTDIVTDVFLKNNKTYFDFIKLIINLFETAIHKYCKELNIDENDIHFMYKGGSIIRLVALETFHLQPGLVTNILNKYYSKYFKRSDSDFSIHVNHEHPNYTQIQIDMKNLSFLILFYIRTIFSNNKQKVFDFYRYKEEYQVELLQGYLKDLNENMFVTNPASPYYKTAFNKISFDTSDSNKADLIISADNSQGTGSAVYKVDHNKIFDLLGPSSEKLKAIMNDGLDSNNKSPFYVSYNDVITFEKDTGETVKFDLVRMKANFKFETEKDGVKDTLALGGEVIDVSIPHVTNPNEEHDMDLLRRYKEEEDGNILSFYSYSLKGLMEDIENILWISSRYPWMDVKYEKRISRLFFLYLVDLLRIEGHGTLEDRYNILVDIVKIEKLLNKILKEKSSYDIHMNEIGKLSRNLSSKYNYKLCHFSEVLAKLMIRIKEDNKLDNKDFKDFLKVCNKNCKVLMKSITELQGQIRNSGLVTTKQIYSIESDTVNKTF